MNCEEVRKRMPGYVDDELDPLTNEAIEEHLRLCPRCEQAYEAERALTTAIQHSAPYHRAPSQMRTRIQSSLREAISVKETKEKEPGPMSKRPEARSLWPQTRWKWLALAAAIVLTAVIALNLHAPRGDEFLATQLIASHVRSLMASHLTDVPSSDQHTVKPWLDEKLDFGAPVVDLSSEGFPLVGGRLDYLDNHPVAALVYQRRKHFINLFVWRAGPERGSAPDHVSRQGYQLVHWNDQDFNYWAVSDVNVNDLQDFKQLFQSKLPSR